MTFFSESRLLSGTDGSIWSDNPSMKGMGWARGLSTVPGIRLAARVDDGVDRVGHQVGGSIFKLPYYVGLGGLFVVLPQLIRAVRAAITESTLVVVRMPGPIGYLAAALSYAYGVPMVVDVAGDIEDVLRSANGLLRFLARPNRILTGAVVRRALAVRYVTTSALQAKYPAAPGVATVAYSSVSIPDEWLDAPVEPTVDPPTVVAIGSQEQMYKGHDLLLRALPEIRRTVPTVQLLLIGDGRRQEELRELARTLGVDSSVEFLGYVNDRDRLRSIIDRAWVFAQPSRTEGLPRAVVEAMARGRACVGTRVGGIPELLQPACLVSRGDSEALSGLILRLLVDEEFRVREQVRNREVARQFQQSELAQREAEWLRAVSSVREEQRNS